MFGEEKMKKTLIVASIVLLLSSGMFAQDGFKDRAITNSLSMPTAYTLNRGEFQVGLGPIHFGITDKVQVGTNILLMLIQDYNVKLKVNLLDNESGALAGGVKLHSFDLKVFGADSNFTSISPFATYSMRLGPKTLLHAGGQYSFFTGEEDIEKAEAMATSSGTSVNLGIEYDFSNRTRFLAETSYDFTFKGMRLGGAVLWGWKSFRLKLGVNYFSPKGSKSFIFPVIGLWWRFGG
jgi:hypothetical protein